MNKNIIFLLLLIVGVKAFSQRNPIKGLGVENLGDSNWIFKGVTLTSNATTVGTDDNLWIVSGKTPDGSSLGFIFRSIPKTDDTYKVGDMADVVLNANTVGIILYSADNKTLYYSGSKNNGAKAIVKVSDEKITVVIQEITVYNKYPVSEYTDSGKVSGMLTYRIVL
jgi:hypothetical protein